MNSIIFKRHENALFSDVGGDIVALQVDRGFCYGMENVSADVWKCLAMPMDLDQLCAVLIKLYDVDPKICRSEVSRLLSYMIAEVLIEAIETSRN